MCSVYPDLWRRRRHSTSLLDAAPLDTASPPQTPPRYYSALKKAHKDRIIPELREEDLEETFVRGMAFDLFHFTIS